MNYPIWHLTTLAGGFWVALIATTHVFVAHFAVGGGLFLVLTEAWAQRTDSSALRDFVRKHTAFFLHLTMVFGAVSGVGIWFIISVLSPAATSTLIHHFAWGFATEWVFFGGEIVALLIYHYSFERMTPRDHLLVGWAYFAFAWLSLFVINGIIAAMLTPGKWLVSGNFWDGFFNPTFWPSLVFRSFLAFMIAGLFGFLTAVRMPNTASRDRVMRLCALWSSLALPFLCLSGWWYLAALPPETATFITQTSREITPYFWIFPLALILVMLGSLIMVLHVPKRWGVLVAGMLLLSGFAVLASFEFIREAGRKPWIIHGHTWAQGIRLTEAGPPNTPFLPRARWARTNMTSQTDIGHELFALQCLACHSLGGPMKDIRTLTKDIPVQGMEAYLNGQGTLFTHMPPFLGDATERRALAEYVAVTLNGHSVQEEPVHITPVHDDIPFFDGTKAEYVLLAWPATGLHAFSDAKCFSLGSTDSALTALILRRGENPEILDDNTVAITYAAPANMEQSGNVNGSLHFDPKRQTFGAINIPARPYEQTGGVNPYPVFTVTATSTTSGAVLAQTKVVLPVSAEMGCRKCHGGPWRTNGMGISDQTATAILAVHDKRSGTRLLSVAQSGKTVHCQDCHSESESSESKTALGLSAALHGFHAHYLQGQKEDACISCHAADPHGQTRFLRDSHAAMNMGCPKCHGFLEDHALALLKREEERGHSQAQRYMRGLVPRTLANAADIQPRSAWIQAPDCMTCHGVDGPAFQVPTAFNVWTASADELYARRKDAMDAVPCIACHGAPHAVYPARNAYGPERDNLQPLQYMGFAGAIGRKDTCTVCHIHLPDGDAHH